MLIRLLIMGNGEDFKIMGSRYVDESGNQSLFKSPMGIIV